MTEPVVLKRPARAAGFMFLGLAAWVAVWTPFVPDVDPAEFFLGGLAYCLFLAAFAVGLTLAGRRARGRWLLAGTGMALGMAGLVAWFLAAGPVPSDAYFGALPWVLAALTAYLGAGAVIAGSGWVRFYRGRGGTAAAQPGPAADRAGGSGLHG